MKITNNCTIKQLKANSTTDLAVVAKTLNPTKLLNT